MKRPTEYDREPLIIDTGATTKHIQRTVIQRPDIWKLTYSSPWTTRNNPYPYALEFICSYYGETCFLLASYDLEELIEECRSRGLKGVRGVV